MIVTNGTLNGRDMPRNAATRLKTIDFVGTPAAIGSEIERLIRESPCASLRPDLEAMVDFTPR
jgi:hypothetical protein